MITYCPKQAAETLGYKTKEDWDESIHLPYMDKEFVELTHDEKQAMRLVGLEPIDKFDDIWWEDCDAVSKKAAETLGFDEHKWDHDYAIRDLPVEEKYWKELSEEQRKAARYFGYNRSTWDEVEYDDDDSYASDDDEKLESGMENLNVGGGKKPDKKPGKGSGKASKPKPKVKFGCTTMYGGEEVVSSTIACTHASRPLPSEVARSLMASQFCILMAKRPTAVTVVEVIP